MRRWYQSGIRWGMLLVSGGLVAGAAQRGSERMSPAPEDPRTVPVVSQPEPRVPDAPADRTVRAGNITLDPVARTASFPASIALANGALEVVIATPKGRLHEALLVADVSPLKLQAVLYALNLSNGSRLTDDTGRRGDLLDIDLAYTGADGTPVREPVENWIQDVRTGKPLVRQGWVFTGSVMRDGLFLAEEEGNICINFSAGSTILDSPDPQSTDDTIHVVENAKAGPLLGTQVTVILTARQDALPPQ